MRRPLLLLALLLTGATTGASAQARAGLTATLDTTTKQPLLQLSNLFGGTPWREAVEQAGVSLRLAWRVEVWRKGNSIIGDKLLPSAGEWAYLIQRQSTLKQYRIIQTVSGHTVRDMTYNSLDALNEKEFGAQLKPIFNHPTQPGEYYYSVTVEITTLSDEDVNKLLAAQGQRGANVLDAISRAIGGFFLPIERLGPVTTGTFRVR